jgi:hypothetical protein
MLVRSSTARAMALCAVVTGAVVGFTSACSPDNTPSTAPANTIVVHFYNMSAAAGAVDVYDSTAGEKLIASNIAYQGGDSTIISGGSHWWDYTKTGLTAVLGQAVGTATFLPQESYDTFISDSGGVEATQTLPDIPPDTISTNTKVRVVNVLPTPGFPGSGTTGYDVYFTAPGSGPATGSPAASGLTFGLNSEINSGPTYLSETPGPTEIWIQPNADTVAADAVASYTTTLTAGQLLTVFVTASGTPNVGQLVIVRDK